MSPKWQPFERSKYLVFIDGQLSASQMFHGERLERYLPELEARIAQFLEGGWFAEPITDEGANH